MVNLKNISKVGTGTYRMEVSDNNHYQAMLKAYSNGYNLIDTATNYRSGHAEELIGKLISMNPGISEKIFIISKTGYIPSKNKISQNLNGFLKKNKIEKAYIDKDFEYSIDPKFLNFQLETSLFKIKRTYIDAYLLQNPERYLQSNNLNDKDKLYNSIKLAFIFFEKKVKEKKIRYYGISSNNLFLPEKQDSLDLRRLIKIAKSIDPNHHFKMIQFPFNFKEQLANSSTYNGKSLLEIAKSNGLITIANRPLNMSEKGFEFRFINYDKDLWEIDEQLFFKQLDKFFKTVDEELSKISDGENNIDDFEPMVMLKNHITEFISLDSLNTFFYSQVYPFLQLVFDKKYNRVIKELNFIHNAANKFVLKNISNHSEELMLSLTKQGVIEKSNYPITACNYYLNEVKIDHILMGLRKTEYVEGLKGNFRSIII